MNIRPLRDSDLGGVLAIERCAMTGPWTEAQIRSELTAANGLALVADCGDALCGYVFFRKCPPECELLHLAVAPAWRRQGVGAALLRQGLFRLAGEGCTVCFLEVRPSNEAARQLYAHAGFIETGRRKHYYSQPVEDALLMHGRIDAGDGGTP